MLFELFDHTGPTSLGYEVSSLSPSVSAILWGECLSLEQEKAKKKKEKRFSEETSIHHKATM